MSTSGQPNTTVDVTTDVTSSEIVLDQLGTNISLITRTSSAWLSASLAVSVYIKVKVCSNDSASRVCDENGFYLPSVEHYFTCEGNKSKDGCICTCPSVFQRTIDPESFHFFRNVSESMPTSTYPLTVGALFDVTTSIYPSIGDAGSDDIIITTNNSFLVFRHDRVNTNFLPAGSTLANSICEPNSANILFHNCDGIDTVDSFAESAKQDTLYSTANPNECLCEFVQDSILFTPANEKTSAVSGPAATSNNVAYSSRGRAVEYWEEEEEDKTKPLIAVVVSLCVAIFAAIALITGYMLVEVTSRRKHVRNTKIRPFVS